MSEALTDVTGGIVERFELGHKAPADLQNIMLTAFKKSSLMGCSVDVNMRQHSVPVINCSLRQCC